MEQGVEGKEINVTFIEGEEECQIAFCILSTFRQLAEKVERFACKEAKLAKQGEWVPMSYPDPSLPYTVLSTCDIDRYIQIWVKPNKFIKLSYNIKINCVILS